MQNYVEQVSELINISHCFHYKHLCYDTAFPLKLATPRGAKREDAVTIRPVQIRNNYTEDKTSKRDVDC